MRKDDAEDVRSALVALLSGRAAHPSSAAARMITPDDVKKAKAILARLGEIRSRNGAERSSQAEIARRRDVLHAAVELFYDRFAAAVDLALEDDDAARVALLSLVPRRKERRGQAGKPPVSSSIADVA